jgi:hypothetical protein
MLLFYVPLVICMGLIVVMYVMMGVTLFRHRLHTQRPRVSLSRESPHSFEVIDFDSDSSRPSSPSISDSSLRGSRSSTGSSHSPGTYRVAAYLFLYPLGILICYIPPAVNRFYQIATGQSNFGMIVAHVVFRQILPLYCVALYVTPQIRKWYASTTCCRRRSP